MKSYPIYSRIKQISLLCLILGLGACSSRKTSEKTITQVIHQAPSRAPVNEIPRGNQRNQNHKETVISAYPNVSEIGLSILRKGGNAVDAAIAMQFSLAVVSPNSGNIGGGGFMIYRSASGQVNALDFREMAPLEAFQGMYLDQKGNPIEDLSLYGQLASGIPGSVDGMVKAHATYGSLPWQVLLQPAIELARNGYLLTANQAQKLNKNREGFLEQNPEGTVFTSKAQWLVGDKVIQHDLARTLEAIRDKGRAGFYEGEIANKMVREMERGNGIITLEDLKSYQAVWRKPLIDTYRDHKIIAMPPASSGGLALIQKLKNVETFPLPQWGPQGDSTSHVTREAERKIYGNQRPSYKDVTNFSVVDKAGNAVSIATTLNGSYGSLVVVNEAGFLLNNGMNDFSAKAGVPNRHEIITGQNNSIQPAKRMLSDMTPIIIEKDGKLFKTLGASADITMFQSILNAIDFEN